MVRPERGARSMARPEEEERKQSNVHCRERVTNNASGNLGGNETLRGVLGGNEYFSGILAGNGDLVMPLKTVLGSATCGGMRSISNSMINSQSPQKVLEITPGDLLVFRTDHRGELHAGIKMPLVTKFAITGRMSPMASCESGYCFVIGGGLLAMTELSQILITDYRTVQGGLPEDSVHTCDSGGNLTQPQHIQLQVVQLLHRHRRLSVHSGYDPAAGSS
ncbi:PR domain zinc finger protein 10 [Bagarius yarrelli]|uniref:PR domain zinc finger protein 10 n=1 Tax=Bagarius yarrelli TaxID=175774 RepID=A0A556U3R9_BAGYA|nr:PR domain zinc finger protein 10 [Bagarius yarrelli]